MGLGKVGIDSNGFFKFLAGGRIVSIIVKGFGVLIMTQVLGCQRVAAGNTVANSNATAADRAAVLREKRMIDEKSDIAIRVTG